MVKLSGYECGLLLQLIRIVEASEWDAGDYCFTQRQFDALQRVKQKLQLQLE